MHWSNGSLTSPAIRKQTQELKKAHFAFNSAQLEKCLNKCFIFFEYQHTQKTVTPCYFHLKMAVRPKNVADNLNKIVNCCVRRKHLNLDNIRKENSNIIKGVFDIRPYETRKNGRPNLRRALAVKNWKICGYGWIELAGDSEEGQHPHRTVHPMMITKLRCAIAISTSKVRVVTT
jgi:hypothetical protein